MLGTPKLSSILRSPYFWGGFVLFRCICSWGQVQRGTVEPPISDSPRYRPPPYNGQTMCPQLILYIFNLRDVDNLLFPNNGQNTCSQRTSSCTKWPPRANSDWSLRWKMWSASKFRYIATQQRTQSTQILRLSIFIYLVCLHEVADSVSYRPHPPHCNFAAL